MNAKQILAKLAHYALAGLGVVVAGIATHVTNGELLSVATAEHWAAASFVVWLSGLFINSVGPAKPSTTTGAARVAVLLALLAISPALLACPGPAKAEGATVTVIASGDTARVFVSWPASNKATSYLLTVAAVASNGTWAGLPTGQTTSSLAVTAVGISSTADTAVFQACVRAVGVSGPAPAPGGCSSAVSSAKNTWHRTLVSPTPVVDSIALRPNPITLQLAGSRIACAFHGFHDGQIAERTADKSACDSLYRKAFSLAHRAPTATEQKFADTATWQWSTTNPAAIGLVPNGFGSAAVRVQGNGLTLRRGAVQLERYASFDRGPVLRIDSTYTNPDGAAGAAVTCLRPGSQVVAVAVEKARTIFTVDCREPAPTALAAR